MRVVTLLPAATEIVAALGAGDRLVGISHECDYPPSVRHLPRVTTTPIDVRQPGTTIDAAVRKLQAEGRPVIQVDADVLRRLAPDLIITQELCQVCAVSDGQIHQLATLLQPAPRVLSLSAHDLAGIWTDIRTVGEALDLADEAQELILGLTSRLRRLTARDPAQRSQAYGIPRVICVEWLEPLYLAGHWVPELVVTAGGEDVGAEPGARSRRREWSELDRLRPDLLIIMLCGFDGARAFTELSRLSDPTALSLMRRTPSYVIDGNAYSSRPGPRVVDGAELIRAALKGLPMDGLERWKP